MAEAAIEKNTTKKKSTKTSKEGKN